VHAHLFPNKTSSALCGKRKRYKAVQSYKWCEIKVVV
jgi:hypothetical protein